MSYMEDNLENILEYLEIQYGISQHRSQRKKILKGKSGRPSRFDIRHDEQLNSWCGVELEEDGSYMTCGLSSKTAFLEQRGVKSYFRRAFAEFKRPEHAYDHQLFEKAKSNAEERKVLWVAWPFNAAARHLVGSEIKEMGMAYLLHVSARLRGWHKMNRKRIGGKNSELDVESQHGYLFSGSRLRNLLAGWAILISLRRGSTI